MEQKFAVMRKQLIEHQIEIESLPKFDWGAKLVEIERAAARIVNCK